MQFTSHNILGLVTLILVIVPLLTNCSLIKGIKIFFGELQFDYAISSQSSYLINACNIFKIQFVAYENLQRFWILETHRNGTHFENKTLEFATWN